MGANQHSTFQARPLLLATLTGAAISIVSAVAYPHTGQDMPVVANIVVAAASVAVLPGYILSAYITNIHNANLILAGVMNFFLYGGLALWLLNWRRRRKLIARP